MSDLITKEIEQLPELTAVSADAFTIAQEPGGTTGKLKLQKLLGKLIATDLVKASTADLSADLAHGENTVALVVDDSDTLANGWWRKIGAAGGGSWEQFETLGLALRSAFDDGFASLNAQMTQVQALSEQAFQAASRIGTSSSWKPKFRLVNDAGNIALELAADDVPGLKTAVAAITAALATGSLVTAGASWVPRARMVNTAGNVVWDSMVADAKIAVLEKQVATVASPRMANGVAVLGDSRAAAVFIDNQARLYGSFAPINWANALLGQRLNIVAALGVSGERSDQIAARMPQAIASGARILYLLCGVNDLGQGRTGAATAANMIAMADQARAAGMIVLIEAEVGSGNFSATQVAQLHELNARLFAYARATPGVHLHDARTVVMEPATGEAAVAYKAGHAYDLTHANTRGAAAWGKSLAVLLGALVEPRPLLLPAQRADIPGNGRWQLLRNPIFYNATGGVAGGNASGSVPLHWEVRGTTGSPVAASVAPASGAPGNRVTLSANFDGQGKSATLLQLPETSAYAVGDVIQFAAEIVIIDATALASIQLLMEHSLGGGAAPIAYGSLRGVSGAGHQGPLLTGERLTLLTPQYTVQAATAANPYLAVSVRAEATGAGSAAFAVDRMALNRIPQL